MLNVTAMKVIPFPHGKKKFRFVVPAKKSPTGKTRAYYFATKAEAEKKLLEFKRHGASALADPLEIKAAMQAQADGNRWQYLVERFGLSPEQIDRALAREVRIAKLSAGVTVRQAVEQYQEMRKTKVDPATWDADRWRLIKLFDPFEKRLISDITETDLRNWFDRLALKINTRSVHKSVRTFFGYAKKYNLVAENPMLGLEPQGDFGINNDIYTPATFERMLRIAAGMEAQKAGQEPTRDFIDLLPWFALSGFCGLRTSEAYRIKSSDEAIRWSDLYFDRGFVDIRAEVAKPKTPARHIERPHALAAAKAWLDLVQPKTEFVVPWTHRKIQDLKREFTETTEIKFIENALRNSFASYALTYTGLDGVGKLALEMGNSERICKKHYIKRLDPGSGKTWYGIRPDRPGRSENVIVMAPAAA
jgi:integrase